MPQASAHESHLPSGPDMHLMSESRLETADEVPEVPSSTLRVGNEANPWAMRKSVRDTLGQVICRMLSV